MDKIILASEIRIYYKKCRENCEAKKTVFVFPLFLKEMTCTKSLSVHYLEWSLFQEHCVEDGRTILPNAKLEFSESPMGPMSSSLLCVCPTRKQKNWRCCCMPRVWSQPSHWVSRSTGFKICHPKLWFLAPHSMISSLVLQGTHFHPVLTRLYTSHISKEPCTHLHLHN